MALSDDEKNIHNRRKAAFLETIFAQFHHRKTMSRNLVIVICVLIVLSTGLFAGWQVWLNPHPLSSATFIVPSNWGASGGSLEQIISGSDGNLWFLSLSGNWIGRITPKGVFRKFPLDYLGIPLWTTLEKGTDGTVWANAFGSYGLFRLDPFTDTLKTYHYSLGDATVAHDGTIWFKEDKTHSIGHLDFRTGAIQLYPVDPTAGRLGCCVQGITEGGDGDIWFTAGNNEFEVMQSGSARQEAQVARLDPQTGRIAFFPVPDTFLSSYQMLIPARDGGVWFMGAVVNSNSIIDYPVYVSSSGKVTKYQLPNGDKALNFTLTSNGVLWMTYRNLNERSPVMLARVEGRTIESIGKLPEEDSNYMTCGPDHHLWITADHAIERVEVSC